MVTLMAHYMLRYLTVVYANIAVDVLLYEGDYQYCWHVYVHGISIWNTDLNLGYCGAAISQLLGYFCRLIYF